MLKSLTDLLTLNALQVQHLNANGMNFTIRSYDCPGLGHVSTMEGKGLPGMMKMDTLIINPTEVDLPLYSYDRITFTGTHILIVELVDTTINPFSSVELDAVVEQFSSVPNQTPAEHWYDSLRLPQSISKKGKKSILDELELVHFKAYLDTPRQTVDDKQAKHEKTAAYVNGLLEKGGPSTDVFKKAIGPEKTAQLFREVLFGTKAPE